MTWHIGRPVFGIALAAALCLSTLIDQRGVAQGSTFSISGRVVDGKAGQAAAGATVFAATSDETLSQRTNPNGEFAFTFSKPVRIRLWADKPGYLRAYAGQMAPTDSSVQGVTIPVVARLDGVLLRLWPLAAIGGKISSGTDAVAGATVVVLRREYRGSGFTWARVPLKSPTSDDRGLYRIAGLEPGHYMVAVLGEKRSGSRTGPGPTFAPGTHTADTATEFALVAGADATGDVQLDATEVAGSIAGRILNGDGGAAGVTVRLRRLSARDGTATDLDELTVVTDDSGTYRFSDVPVGAYKLRVVQFARSEHPLLNLFGSFHGYAFSARLDDPNVPPVGAIVPALPTAPTLYAERDVLVDSQGSDAVLVRLQPAAFVSGRVLFQDGTPPPDELPTVPMLIRPADGSDLGGIPQARIERDGTFRSVGLPPGDYVVVPLLSWPQLSQSWTTVALTSDGTDLLGGAINVRSTDVTDVLVTLSTKSAEVSGTVHRPTGFASGLPTRVIIFPKSERLRSFYYAFPSPKRVVQANVSSSGAFRAPLPPGEYLAAAIADELPESWMTADYLVRLLPWATPIRLGVGDRVTIVLEARAVVFAR